MVIDMATAAMVLGEAQIAAREGRSVRLGKGLDTKSDMVTGSGISHNRLT